MLTEHINPLGNFGYIIRAERERQGLSLYDLAEKAKVHARVLTLFECGDSSIMDAIKIHEFTRIINALGYTVKFELTTTKQID